MSLDEAFSEVSLVDIGGRTPSKILRAVFEKQHYIALRNMYQIYPNFTENLKRYLTGGGEYPYQVVLRTPTGSIRPVLYAHDDLLTINEIFCREDYLADEEVSVVIDVGSNIGISALYFLTRNHTSRCYLFEPDPRNVEKLRLNLAGFETRFSLREEAVADMSGMFRFGIESTGRYGGIEVETDEHIQVHCLNINEVLREILAKEEIIDILKIDTEGLEVRTVKSIRADFLKRIRRIYIEANPKEELHSAVFTQRQYGSVCQLTNKLAKP